MIKHFIETVVVYFFVPYSMVLFAGFGFFAMRDCIKNWLQERKENQAAKKSVTDDQPAKGGKL
jgi:hypothetical protein